MGLGWVAVIVLRVLNPLGRLILAPLPVDVGRGRDIAAGRVGMEGGTLVLLKFTLSSSKSRAREHLLLAPLTLLLRLVLAPPL